MNPHNFKGSDYDASQDFKRLSTQFLTVKNIVQDGDWYTLREIADKTGFMDSSVSRYLRYMRAPEFGGYTVEKRACGDRSRGLFEYRVTASEKTIG